MKNKFTPYIYVLLLLMSCYELTSQEKQLSIVSCNKKDTILLEKINYKRKHKDSVSILNEIKKTSEYLKNIGYFINTLDSIIKKDNKTVAYFTLNEKIENVFVFIKKDLQYYFDKNSIKNDSLNIPIEDLQSILADITQKLDDDGKSFSKVSLTNINIKRKKLFANLNVIQSKKRIINRAIIKGYEEFPKPFLKHYFSLEKNSIFNQKRIEEISNLSNNLNFIKEIKKPEVLFTKDSTILYLYLKKQQNNSFDGIINFSSNEDEGLLFNGTINLTLNNILNKGEKFSLLWNSIANERQEFQISTTRPYLFKSKFTPELSFTLYKQDSTFLNTKFDSKILYNFNPKNQLAITYSSENSSELEEISEDNINSFNNYFIGLLYRHQKQSQNLLLGNKFLFEVNPSYGVRNSNFKENQFKLEITLSYLLSINNRNYLFLKNKTGHLTSENKLTNELFRIGGVNSLRGFNEQEFFTASYNYTNIEYRYLLNETSLFYTITDIGFLNETNQKPIGFGVGYRFTNEKFLINLGIALGNDNENQFKLNNSKILINWVNFF
ncbi:hypothetical protein [Polaribacter sp. WD7]|uniref:hypothetical protein n=1 Tax=Polaribacter sp. WD7 TaxID=2269061 RepID=UPI0011BE10DC|nr:hypothetical protein [Polaribacter sp. WD7]